MRNSAGPEDAPDTAPDQHGRPRHVAPLRTANDRTARLGLERPPTTAEFHTRPLGTRKRLVYALCELSQPGVEDGSFGLGIGRQRVQPPAQLLLGLQQPRLECRDCLGALAVEAGGYLCLPPLEPLRTGISDLRESVGEDRLRFAGERLHRAVELT